MDFLQRICRACVLVTVGAPALAISVFAATPSVQDANAIDAFVQEGMAAGRPPGLAVALTRGEQVVYVKGHGTAGPGRAVTADTQFFLASVSKSFTALTVLQLVEDGLMTLDAPVRTYLPDFTLADPAAARRITVRHLLHHRSGLADGGFDEHRHPRPTTIAEQVARLRDAQPIAPPGTEFHYFNPNYAVLARVVEVVSGQPFSDYLATNVFAPLGMANTVHVVTSMEAAERADRLADGHLQAFGLAFPAPEMAGYLGGSGGVISTAEDMARYLIMLNNEGRFAGRQILSPDGIALMRTPPPEGGAYAMGWERATENGRQVVEHNGILSTFTADITLVPETGEGVLILANVNSLPSTLLAMPRLKRGLLALMAGEPPPAGGRFTVGAWGLLVGAITVVGAGFSLRSLPRLPRWAAWARAVPLWRAVPGVVWPSVPALALAGLPWLVASTSGRVFSFEQIVRSMLSISICLAVCGAFGVANSLGRIVALYRRPSGSAPD